MLGRVSLYKGRKVSSRQSTVFVQLSLQTDDSLIYSIQNKKVLSRFVIMCQEIECKRNVIKRDSIPSESISGKIEVGVGELSGESRGVLVLLGHW